MKSIFSLCFIGLLLTISCKQNSENTAKDIVKLETGNYRVVLKTMDNGDLAFNMKVNSPNDLELYNADEVIEAEEITYKQDSVIIRFPAFEGYLAGKIEDSIIDGVFVKESVDRIVPFKAYLGEDFRYKFNNKPNANIEGNWEAIFSESDPEEMYVAKGIFKQNENRVTGTFRTLTGDYRFLDGVIDGDSLKLSAFDASHAFLFLAKVTDSTINGNFYSGNHFKEPFSAKRNPDYELQDSKTLTQLKEGYERIDFSFQNDNDKVISLSDPEFKDKVIVIQIMGTWCPNCLDETKYLSDFYNNLENPNFEIIGLAFEYAKTMEKAMQGLKRLREDVGVNYPLLLAQYGSSSKSLAQEKLPMLNHVLSYPTTIILNKDKEVISINTGFNGPATGEKYEEFKRDFEKTIFDLHENQCADRFSALLKKR